MAAIGRRIRISRRGAVTALIVLAPLLVFLAGAGFAALESNTVSSYWEGLWWALSLMTTVGFVGESPETTGGHILSAVLMVSGFALLAVATAAIATLFVRQEEEPDELRERAFEELALERFDDLAARLTAIEETLAREGASQRVEGNPAFRSNLSVRQGRALDRWRRRDTSKSRACKSLPVREEGAPMGVDARTTKPRDPGAVRASDNGAERERFAARRAKPAAAYVTS